MGFNWRKYKNRSAATDPNAPRPVKMTAEDGMRYGRQWASYWRQIPISERNLARAIRAIAPSVDVSRLEIDASERFGKMLRAALVDPSTSQGASIADLTYVTRMNSTFWDRLFGGEPMTWRTRFMVAALAGFRVEFRLVPIDATGRNDHHTIAYARHHLRPFNTRDWQQRHDYYSVADDTPKPPGPPRARRHDSTTSASTTAGTPTGALESDCEPDDGRPDALDD